MEHGKVITNCWGQSFSISSTTTPITQSGKTWSLPNNFHSPLHVSTFVSTLSDYDIKNLCHHFLVRGLGNTQDIQNAIFNGQLKVFPEANPFLTSSVQPNGSAPVNIKTTESRSLLVIRSDIKTTLKLLVDQERLDAEQIEKSYQKRSSLSKVGAHVNKFANGLYNSGESLLIWVKDVNDVVNTNQRLLRIMKAASIAKQADENDRYQVFQNTLAASEKKEIIEALGFDPSLITAEKTTQAYELAQLIYDDQLTQLIITQFIKDYINAQHSLEWSEFSGGAAFEVILTAILTIFTGGVGLVASVGAKARHALELKKLGKLFLELAEGLRKIPKERNYSLRKAKEKEDKAQRKKAISKQSDSETKNTNDDTMLDESVVPNSTKQLMHQETLSTIDGDDSSPTLLKKEYQTTPMNPRYYGEDDIDDDFRWNKPEVCKYFDYDKLAACELDVNKDGLLVNKLTGDLFDSSTAQTHWGGGAIFIMDQKGKVYASNTQTPLELHHSSLTNGKPVAAAGELQVKNGILEKVSNKSGHYSPTQTLNTQLFDEFEHRGIDKDILDDVERFGYKDDNSYLKPTEHRQFVKADEWSAGDEIPYDWSNF